MLALLFLGVASCHNKIGNANGIEIPDGVSMQLMKVDGCSFLYPSFLSEPKTTPGEETEMNREGHGVFVLNGSDLMNALVYDVRRVDNPYSKDAAEEFLENLKKDEGSTLTNSQITDDGFVFDVEVLNPQVSLVKLYTTIAFKIKDKKSITLTYTCTENNKEKMLAVKDAIVKSMEVE